LIDSDGLPSTNMESCVEGVWLAVLTPLKKVS